MAIDRNNIDKVFDQKFSFHDHKNLVKYFEDSSLNEETKQIVKAQWEQFNPIDKDRSQSLDNVFYKLYYTINGQKDSASKGKRLFLKISQIAAILIIGILVASIYFSAQRGEKEITQQVEFTSHNGFRNQFKLPDGTSGWLGYSSNLTYHVDRNNQRIVTLNGLAFFNVAHRQKQPFIVKTPTKLNIEVLGTRFNVLSYSKDNTSEIILEQGSVKLNIDNRNIGNMVPNERTIYNSENNSIQKSYVNVSDFVAWKDGKLILDDFSLKETCQKLGRFYNVEFELKTEGVDMQRVRLVLEDETLEDALNLLAMIVPVKYQVDERTMLDNNTFTKKKIIIKNK